MHPGPVNRGVELSADAIDSPQALIAQQVEAGVVVRMAVLYELLAGAGSVGTAPGGLVPNGRTRQSLARPTAEAMS
jgi:aspartate carbamoyltransferase catalytic subunit